MALTYDKALYDSQYSVRAWAHGVRNTPRVPRHHYSWFVQKDRIANTAAMIAALPGFASINKVVLIGSGFGWTAEILIAANPAMEIISVDPSPYVQSNWNVSEETEIRDWLTADGFDPDNIDFLVDPATGDTLTNAQAWAQWLRPDGQRSPVQPMDEDLTTNASRNAVKGAVQGNYDLIITEWVLDSWTTDAEIEAFLNDIEAFRPNPSVVPVHIIDRDPTPPDGMINKSLNDWRAYLDARGFNHWVVNSRGEVGV